MKKKALKKEIKRLNRDAVGHRVELHMEREQKYRALADLERDKAQLVRLWDEIYYRRRKMGDL